MKKSFAVVCLIVFVSFFTGCAEMNQYFAKANYDRQEAEGQTVVSGDYTAAYYAAQKTLQDDNLKIVSASGSTMPIVLVGETYKMRSEGDRLGGTVVANLFGGKKATKKVVEKEVISRTIVIKERYDSTWKVIPGKMGILISGEKTGRNGEGETVEVMEKEMSPADEMKMMEKVKSLIAEYTKYPDRMGK